ncbi:hypothetical protein FOFC_00105, partial [Fusarium oxysporum]
FTVTMPVRRSLQTPDPDEPYLTKGHDVTPGEPCSSAGPNLLSATHFKGHSFADPYSMLKSSTLHYNNAQKKPADT